MLEIFQFIAICLACFSFGFSLSNLLNQRIHRSADKIINLQKAEIKKYQKCIEHFTFTYDINGIKAEAVEEFADMLKAKYRCYDLITPLAAIIEVDNTKKEMVGDV